MNFDQNPGAVPPRPQAGGRPLAPPLVGGQRPPQVPGAAPNAPARPPQTGPAYLQTRSPPGAGAGAPPTRPPQGMAANGPVPRPHILTPGQPVPPEMGRPMQGPPMGRPMQGPPPMGRPMYGPPHGRPAQMPPMGGHVRPMGQPAGSPGAPPPMMGRPTMQPAGSGMVPPAASRPAVPSDGKELPALDQDVVSPLDRSAPPTSVGHSAEERPRSPSAAAGGLYAGRRPPPSSSAQKPWLQQQQRHTSLGEIPGFSRLSLHTEKMRNKESKNLPTLDTKAGAQDADAGVHAVNAAMPSPGPTSAQPAEPLPEPLLRALDADGKLSKMSVREAGKRKASISSNTGSQHDSTNGEGMSPVTAQDGPLLDHSHLEPGDTVSLLSHTQTLDMYRQNAKKSNDPTLNFELAVFMLDVARSLEASPTDVQFVERKKLNERTELVKEAVSILKKLADRGHTESQYLVGDCYASGLATGKDKPDFAQAYAYFTLAAKHGHPDAAYRAGTCYEKGWGCRRDVGKAVQFYRKAASQGHPGAQYRLGTAELNGELGLKRSARVGVKWLKRSAERATPEFPHALHELALLHEKGIHNVLFADPDYSCELLAQAAEMGYAPSAYKLGVNYEHGRMGCPQDCGLSIHMYNIAAQQNHRDACFALTAWYLVGAPGILPQSDTEAYLWAKRAAEQGLAKAEYACGYFSEMGVGTPKDLGEAKGWYLLASEHGDKRADVRLAPLSGHAAKPVGKKEQEDLSETPGAMPVQPLSAPFPGTNQATFTSLGSFKYPTPKIMREVQAAQRDMQHHALVMAQERKERGTDGVTSPSVSSLPAASPTSAAGPSGSSRNPNVFLAGSTITPSQSRPAGLNTGAPQRPSGAQPAQQPAPGGSAQPRNVSGAQPAQPPRNVSGPQVQQPRSFSGAQPPPREGASNSAVPNGVPLRPPAQPGTAPPQVLGAEGARLRSPSGGAPNPTSMPSPSAQQSSVVPGPPPGASANGAQPGAPARPPGSAPVAGAPARPPGTAPPAGAPSDRPNAGGAPQLTGFNPTGFSLGEGSLFGENKSPNGLPRPAQRML